MLLLPIINDDSAEVDQDGSAIIDVMSNYTHPEGYDVFLINAFAPNGGTAAIVDGKVRIRPTPDFFWQTTATYRLDDTGGHVVEGEIALDVIGQIRMRAAE